MSKKSKKQDKPVNISISFNIAQNEALPKDINPLLLRGRKIRNIEHLIKTHRDVSNNLSFSNNNNSNHHTMLLPGHSKPQQILTNRETFSKADPRLDDFNSFRKHKVKRRSMDGMLDSTSVNPNQSIHNQKDVLFMSCENQLSSKPQFFEPQTNPRQQHPAQTINKNNNNKLTPVSRKRASLKSKSKIINQTPQSTRSDLHGKIESTVLKCIMASNQKNTMSLDNLRNLISQLVSAEFSKQSQHLHNSQGADGSGVFQNAHLKSIKQGQKKDAKTLKSPKNRPVINSNTQPLVLRMPQQHKKQAEQAPRKSNLDTKKKHITSSKLQSSHHQTLSLKEMAIVVKSINDSLIKSEASDKDMASVKPNTVAVAPLSRLKTTASSAHLQEMLSARYSENNPASKAEISAPIISYEEQMVMRIQKFWRQYRTKKLVRAYVQILNQAQGLYQAPDFDYNNNGYQEQRDQEQHDGNQFYLEQGNLPIDLSTTPRNEDFNLLRAEEDLMEGIQQDISEQIADPSRLKQFHSYQLGKEEEVAMVAQFKKRQIQKWDQALQLIKSSLGDSVGQNRLLLEQVFKQLENNKAVLQAGIVGLGKDDTNTANKKQELGSFTVPLDSKHQDDNVHAGEGKSRDLLEVQADKELSELRQSYVSSVVNQQLNMFNFSSIHEALNARRKSLQQRREKQMALLDSRLDNDKITKQEYEAEKEKIQKWLKSEEHEIIKAKRELDRGIGKAHSIIRKSQDDKDLFRKLSSSDNKLKKSRSDNFIKTKSIRAALRSEEDEESLVQQESESNNNSESIEELSAYKLKRKLDKLNEERHRHLHSPENSSPDISYQSLSRQYNDDEQEEDDNEGNKKGRDGVILNTNSASDVDLPEYKKSDIAIIRPIPVKSPLQELDQGSKEDIFEFVFLDLCIEFCQEAYSETTMKTVRNYIQKKKRPDPKRNKGIKTNITVVKDYLKRFMSYVMRTNQDILQRVAIPMGPSALEMLRYMHYDEQGGEEEEEDLIGTLILPISLFQTFENSLLAGIEFEPYYDEPEREMNRVEFLKGVIHIHNKAIFDALNESLDLQRPFGIWGKPFPWKSSPEFEHTLSKQQIESKFKESTDKVVEYCTYVCGIIIDKEDSLVAPGTRLSEDYIDQIKEDRLSRMLANDLIQNEERWVFYDDEETEVLVEISQLLYEIVLKQCVQQVSSVFRNRQEISTA